MRPNAVIESIDADTIYKVPLMMKDEKLDEIVLEKFGLNDTPEPDLEGWKAFLDRLAHPEANITVALVGKYVELQDAYKSILEAFIHAGAANRCKVKVVPIHSEYLTEDNVEEKLAGMDGILIAPGFGERGLEGKIKAVRYAREKGVPFFGICLAANPVIDLMADQKTTTVKGGTMRLGAYKCQIEEDSLAYRIYGKPLISERHRHRYELNNDYVARLNEAGMRTSGRNPETGLVEIVEIPEHPFFIGVQFHPEYKSTPENPQPIFVAFVKAALEYSKSRQK